MELTIKTYLIVLPMVFLAALVDSISGGGGLISLPAYTLAGLDYGLASGCNKFSACFGTLSSVAKYAREKRILWIPALVAALGALPGAYLGTCLSMLLSNRLMNIFMICATPVVGVMVAFKKDIKSEDRPITPRTLALCFLSGLLVGAYDGFFGPGTGTFLILLFSALTGMDMLTASATAKPVNLASNISSLVTRIAAGQVIFALALPAMVMSVCGGYLGSKLALKRGVGLIRYVMLGVLALLVLTLILEML